MTVSCIESEYVVLVCIPKHIKYMGFKTWLEKCFCGQGFVDIVALNQNMLLLFRIPKHNKYMGFKARLEKCISV